MSSALVALLIQFRLSLAGSPRHDFRGHRHVPYLDASIELAQVRSVPSEILRHGTSKLTLARYSGSSSVPCVISLSTPKAMAVGTCVGAKKGILVAGGGTHALASLEGEDHVSFVFFRDRSENPALTRIVDDAMTSGKGAEWVSMAFTGVP